MLKKIKVLAILTLISSHALASKTTTISIFATSDLHGHVMTWDYGTDERSYSGSLAQIANTLNYIKKNEKPLNSILVDVGDTIQGNFIETFKDNEVSPMILAFNEMNYDLWVMGNHEFDYGLYSMEIKMQVLAPENYQSALFVVQE